MRSPFEPMSFSDFIYRPFETLIRPLDIPYAPLPARGAFALLLHFARMFRGILVAVTVLMMAIEGINLAVIWGISVIVDGVSAKGAAIFLQQQWLTLAVLGVLVFPVLPLLIFLGNTLNSQAVAVCMPAAMQWQGHKAVERQDLAFFHDLFAGQVASRISQVASAVQQQIVVSFYSIPLFLVQFVGSLVLLATLSWPLALPVLVWIVANIAVAVVAVPHFSERSRRTARTRSLVVGAMTDLYSNIQMVKLFAAEDSEAGAMRTIMGRGDRDPAARAAHPPDKRHERRPAQRCSSCSATLPLGSGDLSPASSPSVSSSPRSPSFSGSMPTREPFCRWANRSSRRWARSATRCRS